MKFRDRSALCAKRQGEFEKAFAHAANAFTLAFLLDTGHVICIFGKNGFGVRSCLAFESGFY
jgi:hypothetical protein